MKKILSLILSLSLMLSLALPAAAAETVGADITYRGIRIHLDGRELTPLDESGGSTEPFILDGSTYLPVRAIAGALALEVQWLPETSTVALTQGGAPCISRGEIASTHGTKTAALTYRGIGISLDGEALELGETEPFIMGGSTYLPLRAIGEALGLTVKWEAETSSIQLLSPEAYHIRVTETLALDREGEMLLETCDTITYNYPRFTLVCVRDRSGEAVSDTVTLLDADGNPTEALFYGPGGELSTTETWTYDEAGLLTRYVRDELDGEENDFCTLLEYKAGRLSRTRLYEGDTIPRVHSTDTTYTYDEAGNIVKLYVHYPYGSWDELLFEYDGAGRLLRESFTGYDILGGGFSRSSTEYFYTDGLLVRSEHSGGEVTEYFYTGEALSKTVTARPDGSFLISEYARA